MEKSVLYIRSILQLAISVNYTMQMFAFEDLGGSF